MSDEIVQEFFSIGEVCELTDLKPHVLRYWESQFRFLNSAKNRSGNRVYQRKEIELIQLVKHLLYSEKYTIEGARQKIDEHRKAGSVKGQARQALAIETLADVERRGNTFEARTRRVQAFTLLLSPDVVDFGKPVRVTVNGRVVHDAIVTKDVATLLRWAARDLDRTMLYAAELHVAVP